MISSLAGSGHLDKCPYEITHEYLSGGGNLSGEIISIKIMTTQPAFQRRINVVSTLWITVEMALIGRWKWNKSRSRILNVAQHWYNVGVQRWNDVKSSSMQPFFKVAQGRFNVVSTLI